MKSIACFVFVLTCLLARAASAADQANTVLIHPGEQLFVRFEQTGSSLKVLNASKEKNDHAQLILRMEPFDRSTGLLVLVVQSRFKKTMSYKAEMRLLAKNRRAETSVVPVLAGLESFESWPHPIDELALYGFELKE